MTNKLSDRAPFLGQRLLIVTAHPDDEAFLVAGSIVLNREAGGAAYVCCATAGERGKTYLPQVNASELAEIRRSELRAVSEFLGVEEVNILNLPDGNVAADENREMLERRLLEIIRIRRPDVLLSFGKDGVTGHLDHIAVGEVVKKVASNLHMPLYCFCAPPAYKKNVGVTMNRRKHGVYCDDLQHGEHSIQIKVDPIIKRKALSFHESQLNNGDPFAHIPMEAQEEILNGEYYAIMFS